MSRIGKLPIKIPEKVKTHLSQLACTVEGPLGKIEVLLDPVVSVAVVDGNLVVTRRSEESEARCRQGLIRNLLNNAVTGVHQGYKRELDITGVGFRAELKGKNLVLALGFSHAIEFAIPEGIKIAVDKLTHLVISGISKQLVGETAAKIRKLRAPEPYKGKGVRYSDEVIRRKVGKSAVASGGGK